MRLASLFGSILWVGLLLLTSGCVTDGAGFAVQGGLYAPTFSGDTGLSPEVDDVDLEQVDIRNELNLDDTEFAPYGRVDAHAAGLYLSASGFQTSQSGTGLLSADFGELEAGTDIESDIEIRLARAEVAFTLVDLGFFRLSPGLGVDFIDLSLDVSEPITGARELVEVTQPIPMVVLQMEFDPPVIPVVFVVDAGGIFGTFEEVDGSYFDIEAFARLDLFSPLTAFVGYRHVMFSLDGTIDDQDFDTDLVLGGFTAGLGLAF